MDTMGHDRLYDAALGQDDLAEEELTASLTRAVGLAGDPQYVGALRITTTTTT